MAFHHNTWTRRHFIASVGVSATVMGAAMTFANTALTTDSSKTLSIVVWVQDWQGLRRLTA